MATKLTELTQSVAIADPQSGRPTQTFLQLINPLLRLLRQVTGDVANITIPLPATDAAIAGATGTGYVSAAALETSAEAVALTDAAPVAVDWAASINFTLTVTASRQIGNPTNGIPGTYRTIIVQGDNTTDRTITFGNQFLGELPTVSDCDSGTWYALMMMCIATDHFAVSAKKVRG